MTIRCSPPFVWNRLDALVLGCLLLIGALLRLPHLFDPYVINSDAIKYIQSAQSISQGQFWEGLRDTHLTLFTVLIGLLQPMVGDFVTAARSLPVLFGVLTVIPFYLLTREILGTERAWLPSLFYCISPAILRMSLDVVRDPLFWFVFAWFLWILLRALREQRTMLYLIAGALALLTMLIRLDGFILIPVSVGFILYTGILDKGWPRKLLNALTIFLPSAILALALVLPPPGGQQALGPEVLKRYERQGKAALLEPRMLKQQVEDTLAENRPKSLRRFIAMAWDHRHAVLAFDVLDHWIHAAHPLLFMLMMLGLFQEGSWQDSRWHFLAVLMTAWLIMSCIRMSGALAISKRHLVPLVMLGYIYGAMGFSRIVDLCGRRLPKVSTVTIVVGLALSLMLVTAPASLRPLRHDKLARKQAGEWIRSLGLSNSLIVTDRLRVAFYAEADRISMRKIRKSPKNLSFLLVRSQKNPRRTLRLRLERALRGSSVGNVLLVFDDIERREAKGGRFRLLDPDRWELNQVKRFQSGGESLKVYHYRRKGLLTRMIHVNKKRLSSFFMNYPG